MSMFDDFDEDKVKDQLLLSLIDKMEDILGDGLKGRKGLGVEIQADSPEGLKAGLDKAGDVMDKGSPEELGGGALELGEPESGEPSSEDSDASDLERLQELLGEDDDDEDDKNRRF